MMRTLSFSIPFLLAVFLASCAENPTEQTPKRATAQDNVFVLPQPLEMKGLDRDRTIRLYLPPGYDTSTQHYPVLYMHDGQNLFDEQTAYIGEWGVDEALNELSKTDSLNLIVVGIDNGGEQRMNELSPWGHQDFLPAEGEAYMDFIVDQVKPYIDSSYRTKPGREHTAIMGGSMGGLISHYALYQYPDIFSKAGVFSPSFWFSEEAYGIVREQPVPEDSRIYLLIGGKEGASMVPGATKMSETIRAGGHPDENLVFTNDPDGVHSESFWGEYFGEAVVWLYAQ